MRPARSDNPCSIIAGLGYLGLNQAENARQAFARAVELNPYQLAARTALASLK